MDKQLIADRFSRACFTYERQALAQQTIAHNMLQLMLDHHLPVGTAMAEFGCGTGFFSRLLCEHFRPSSLLINDLSSAMEGCVASLLNDHVSFRAFDAETGDFPQVQILCSCSALQWFVHPKRFFERVRRCLLPDGWLAFSTFGPDNLQEIRTLTGKGLTYPDMNDLQAMLEPFYDLCYIGEERIAQTFSTPMQVLRHIKETGVNATAPHRFTSTSLTRFCADYQERFHDEEGNVHLTYHPIYVLAKIK